jgi:O-antigen ligase
MSLANRIRGWAAPAFLVLCILLGGASFRNAGVPANGVLQAIATLLILFSVATRRSAPYPTGMRPLLLIGGLWLLLGLIFLIPLPYGLWTPLPGRDIIAQGMSMLGMQEPDLTLSLSPHSTVNSLLRLLPPTAMFLLTLQLSHRQRRRLAAVLLSAAAVSACVGIAQLAGGEGSGLRPYAVTNRNMAVGFFANGNHQATLLLCALGMAGFLLARGATKGKSRRERSALVMAVMIALFLALGVAIVGSLAGYGLLIPVVVGTLLLYRKAAAGKVGTKWAAAAGTLFAGALALALLGPLSYENLSGQLGDSPTSRRVISATTMEAIGDHFPVGSGLGTFASVYRGYEDHTRPNSVYINHAHNDYLEVALEMGLPGILLILAFFIWFARAALNAWRNDREGSNLARAATLVIGVVLVHSLVEYPLRTAALAAVFAMGCALLLPAPARRRSAEKEPESSGLRHMEAD